MSRHFSRWRRHLPPPDKVDGVLAVVGGFALHLTLGTLYCFGNLNTYITSYLRKHVHPGIEYADMIWVPTLATMSQGLFMTCSGHLEERIGAQLTVALGCFIMSSGVLLTSVAIRFSVVLTVFTYGFLFGLGTALAYAPPMAVAMRWFPHAKGLANGCIVGGFGLGAFIFNQIQTAYLNPLNLKLDDGEYFTDDRILHRVPSLFLLLGSIYAVIQAMAAFLIRPPPDDINSTTTLLATNAEGGAGEDESNGLLVGVEDEGEDLELSDPGRRAAASAAAMTADYVKPGMVVRTREFWILWSTFFLNNQAIGYINSMYKAYGQQYIDDDHFLSVVGAVAAVFNAGGRIFWGNLCDACGYKICIAVISVAIAALYATLWFIEFGGKALFAFWIWGIFFCFCANFVLLPTATAQSFGTKYSSKNYGLVMTGQAFSAPMIALLTEFLNPVVGWFGMFMIIAAFSTASAIVNVFFFPKSSSPKDVLARLQKPLPSQL